MHRVLAVTTNLFPVWVLVGGAAALLKPDWFGWVDQNVITWGLAVIMLGMGITLSVAEFKAVLKMPKAVAAGVAAQFLIMPFLGWSIAHLLGLERELAVGLILVSCCPGGTASNVVTFLARANVALSVSMTMCSTFAAIALTPLLTKWLAGTYVPVDAWGLFIGVLKIVLAPLVLGMALHHLTPRFIKQVLPVAPLVSVIAIVIICAGIIAESAEHLIRSGGKLLLAVLLLHGGGFSLGYLFAQLLGFAQSDRRTLAIEVGMQNSGLGASLAKSHFHELALAPLPCAISATMHSVIGSILAGIWRLRKPKS